MQLQIYSRWSSGSIWLRHSSTARNFRDILIEKNTKTSIVALKCAATDTSIYDSETSRLLFALQGTKSS